jgi:hypothetical protein
MHAGIHVRCVSFCAILTTPELSGQILLKSHIKNFQRDRYCLVMDGQTDRHEEGNSCSLLIYGNCLCIYAFLMGVVLIVMLHFELSVGLITENVMFLRKPTNARVQRVSVICFFFITPV